MDLLDLDDTVYSSGSKLTLSETGKIVVGSGVSTVRVSGSLAMSSGISSGDIIRIAIGQNSDLIGFTYDRAGGTYIILNIPPIVVNVTEDDTFELRCNDSARTGATVKNLDYETWLQVEVIK
jgi:hypothetical protein